MGDMATWAHLHKFNPCSKSHTTPHLCNPGDGAQVPAHLEELNWRLRSLTSMAECTTLIYDEGLGTEETQQMWGLFTLADSDLRMHTENCMAERENHI